MATCKALADPETSAWGFCPNVGASIFFAVLFAITTSVHIFQAFRYRKVYSFVIIMANLWQTGAYVTRTLSIGQPASTALYSTWFTLLLCAPLWTNAYVYMVFGRMVWNFKKGARLNKIKAWHIGKIFVCCDIICFMIQIGGAVIAVTSGNQASDSTVFLGLHIYMIGIGVQQVIIILFSIMTFSLFNSLKAELGPDARQPALRLLYILWLVLVIITIRIIFRLTEYAKGLDSTIPIHEAYQYVLDSLPMLITAVLFNFVHPGKIMPGTESDLPGCCARRRRRKEGVALERYGNV